MLISTVTVNEYFLSSIFQSWTTDWPVNVICVNIIGTGTSLLTISTHRNYFYFYYYYYYYYCTILVFVYLAFFSRITPHWIRCLKRTLTTTDTVFYSTEAFPVSQSTMSISATKCPWLIVILLQLLLLLLLHWRKVQKPIRKFVLTT